VDDGKPVYTKRALLDLMEPEFEVGRLLLGFVGLVFRPPHPSVSLCFSLYTMGKPRS
jgi:hypothetical protein